MKSNLIHFMNRLAMAAVVSGIAAHPASAHHSASGYNMQQTQTAQATIKEFRWGAPHSAGIFIIKGPKGEPQELGTSSASPAAFVKKGFVPRDFKVGEKVEITWHPTFSGVPGGILVSIKFPDGRVFRDQEFEAQVGNAPDSEAVQGAKDKQ